MPALVGGGKRGHLVLNPQWPFVPKGVVTKFGISSYMAAILADSPVGYWRLGEASGTVAVDSSGGGNDGTYVNAPTLGISGALTGDSDTAVSLASASSQDVSAPLVSSATNNFAIEAWLELSSLTAFEGLVAFCGDDVSGGGGWGFGVGNGSLGGNGTALTGYLGGIAALSTGYGFADTNWHHIVMTRESGTLKWYVDGVQTGTTSGTAPGSMGGSAAMRIGCQRRSAGGDYRFFNGSVDEVAVYNTALTAAQVLAHYNAGIGAAAGPNNYSQVVSGTLSFTGAQAKQTNRALAAVLNFTGATAKATSRGLSGVLSFTGATTKRTTRGLTAVLSFTGSTTRAITRGLTAVLSFSGTTVKRTARALTGTLSFTGALASGKQFARSLTATLTFTGNHSKLTGKALSATLTFTGTVSRFTSRALAATLTFTGAATKRTARALTAVLTFTGVLAAGKQFQRALTATLTFTGAQARTTGKALTATLTFTGAAAKATRRALTAAALSFTGALSGVKNGGGHAFTQALTATLTFTGNTSRLTSRTLAATASFAGAVSRRTSRPVTATLSFTGSTARRVGRALSGALGFIGSLVRLKQTATTDPNPITVLFTEATNKATVRETGPVAFAETVGMIRARDAVPVQGAEQAPTRGGI